MQVCTETIWLYNIQKVLATISFVQKHNILNNAGGLCDHVKEKTFFVRTERLFSGTGIQQGINRQRILSSRTLYIMTSIYPGQIWQSHFCRSYFSCLKEEIILISWVHYQMLQQTYCSDWGWKKGLVSVNKRSSVKTLTFVLEGLGNWEILDCLF